MPPPQLFINITLPPGQLPPVDRTFLVAGNISWLFLPANASLITRNVTVQFGPGGSTSVATFSDQVNWRCTGTVSPSTPWGSMVQLTINAQAVFRISVPFGPTTTVTLNVSTTFMVRLFPAVAPTIGLTPFPSPIVAAGITGPVRVRGIGDKPAGTDSTRAVQGRGWPVRQRN